MLQLTWFGIGFGLAALLCLALVIAFRRRLRDRLAEYSSLQQSFREFDSELRRQTEANEAIAGELAARRTDLETTVERTRELVELESRAAEIRASVADGEKRQSELADDIHAREAELESVESELHGLKADLDLYTRISDFVEHGHFEEPEYLHEMSERYSEEIKRVRNRQKQMIRDQQAIEMPDGIAVDGSSQKGSQILSGQTKMMLRAFDVECDLLISKVTPANFTRTLERIEKVAEALEKAAVSLMCGFATEYVELKYEECKLYYEFKLKKAAEVEEQRLIKEQMREEQRAIREYEKAIADATREERMFEKMLEAARTELGEAHESERAELETKVSLLEDQLREAQEKEERAKSLAEQTRRGHVYVLSNLGSFGEHIYKIGLTRRLDPLDRVRELGDASVPFSFDVHAIVYSDDAPALEAALHRRFDRDRLNAVNRRKEFFRVGLKSIREAVEEESGSEAQFTMTAMAEEYYETLRLQDEGIAAA